MKLQSVSVFFPCYNEELNVKVMVEQCLTVLPQLAQRFEVIIVNDGSTDRTAKIAERYAKKYSQVKIITHPRNLGYGASLRSGFAQARYDWVFFTDGDAQFDLAQLERFLPFTRTYSAVIGYRNRRAEGSLRAFNARLFKLFIDLLFRVHVKDIDCAFKLFKTELIQALPLTSTGACISAELLYRLKKKQVKIHQVEVDHFPRQFGTPTGNNWRVVLRAGWEALRLYGQMKLHRTS